MNQKILLFGVFADIAGSDILEIGNILSTDEMMKKVLELFPQFNNYKFKLAVNNEIVDENYSLTGNEEVALLPPFSGG
jgi:molybdopterin converting factor small subunit